MLLPLTPLLIPLSTAVLGLATRRSRFAQSAVSLMGALALLGCTSALFAMVWSGGPVRVQMGGWSAPFGIIVYVDTLAASLTVATSIVHLAVTAHGLASGDEDRRRSDFWPLANTMVMGVQGAFVTGDIFNLYVWFEVLLISSFVLVAMCNLRAQIEAAAKYVVLNLLSSASFLMGIALLYGVTGTLNLAELSAEDHAQSASPVISIIAVLFVVGFGIKAAMVPFSLWLPTAYGSPPSTVAALLAGLLTKVGVYSFMRTGALMFAGVVPWFGSVMLIGAFASLFVGALGALSQPRLRGVIVHTVVFAVGFMLLGIAPGTEAGYRGTIVYLLSDMVVVTALLLLGGEIERLCGSGRLARMGGMYRAQPMIAVGFIVVAFSVAGFPPLIGFWGKVALFDAITADGAWSGVLLALVGSAIALSSIAQAWSLGLWKPAPEPEAASPVPTGPGPYRALPIAGLVLLIGAASLVPGPLFEVADRAAADLVDIEMVQRVVLQ